MKGNLLSIVTLTAVLFGCTPTTTVQNNRGVLLEADGRVGYYAGQGIGDILARGEVIRDDHPVPFMRLRVPVEFVDGAMRSDPPVRTVSFEVPDSSIEATVHWFSVQDVNAYQDKRTPQNLYFHPGDPWVSGYAQVGTGPDGFTMGLFEIIKWNKDSQDNFWQEIHTTGLLPDSNMPALTYADNVKQPLPENWK